MTRREIRRKGRRVKKICSNTRFGSPKKRIQALQDGILELATMDKPLEEVKQTLCQLFSGAQEEWSGNYAEKPHVRPVVEPQDCQKAQIYMWGAIACTLLEAALAGFICANLGLPWWSGALVAVLLVVIFDAGFSLAFDEPDAPTKAYTKIRRWLLAPSFSIFVVSALTLLLARTVPESWVPQLVEVFNISLWSTTVSLLLLGGALLAAAHLRGWSGHITALYEALDELQHKVRCVKAELEGQLSTLRAKSPGQQESASSPPLSKQPPVVVNGTVPAAILLLALLSLCPAFTNQAAAQAQLLAPKLCYDMDIYLDHSRSLSEGPFTSTVHELLRQLPQIVEKWEVCGELRVILWAEDAWSASTILSLNLPQLTLRKPQPLTHRGEVPDMFRNVKQALEKRDAAQAAAADAQARQDYRVQVAQALTTITANVLLPSAITPAPVLCSDLNGVLRRITTTTSANPRLVLLVTDGHETCVAALQPVPAPAGTITVVTILIPENATGKKKKRAEQGYDQFETRRAALVHAAPWARVYPYHQRDFVSMFSPERAELALQK